MLLTRQSYRQKVLYKYEPATTDVKLNSLNDKKAKHKSLKIFSSKCHHDKIIPYGLSSYVNCSIGNQDGAFLDTWHEILLSFSLTLMPQVITLCDQTISKGNEEI